MKKARVGAFAQKRYGPYWRQYDTDLDYGKVERVLKPETPAFEETYGQVFGYRTQKGLIQLTFRNLKNVMVQISPRGKVMIYYSQPSRIEGIEDGVRDFIERLCGRRITFAWVKMDSNQKQHYEDTHADWMYDTYHETNQ